MSALTLTLFVSLVLAALGVLLFVHGVLQRDHDHADRLSLLPLEQDDVSPAAPADTSATHSPVDKDCADA